MLLLSRASAREQSGTRSESWQPQIVPHVHHMWHTDTVYEIDPVKAQDMGLNSIKHSVVLWFTSETFQRDVLQESLDTIKRSCTTDHQKSHRTHQQSKQISVHRVTDCDPDQKTKEALINYVE